MILPGDIGFGGKRKGWYPSIVRFLTHSRWSHCFVVMPPYLGELSVLEADLKVQLVPFQKEYVEKDDDYYEIWRPKNATQSEIINACTSLYRNDSGEVYGFMQIPWFAVRQVLRWFRMDLSKNWFPAGEICSETLWQYLVNLGSDYQAAVESLGENECSPEDLYAIVRGRPNLFEFVDRRE